MLLFELYNSFYYIMLLLDWLNAVVGDITFQTQDKQTSYAVLERQTLQTIGNQTRLIPEMISRKTLQLQLAINTCDCVQRGPNTWNIQTVLTSTLSSDWIIQGEEV